MQKTITVASVALVCVFLVGCQQQEAATETAAERKEKAQGYVEKLAKAPDRVQEKVDDAVEKQNQKNEEAAEIIGEDVQQDNNSSKITTMENIPEQINIDFADTCTGATIKTNKGDIELKLYNTDAPVTVANFCTLADKGFYNGVIFHRVIKDFMIQGGDPEGTGMGGPEYKFDDEIHANNTNNVGTISMANAGPGTNGSQFFINTKDNNFLDTKHTVFGEVVGGMETVTEIENVETGAQDRPKEDVVIESIVLAQ